MFEFLAIFLTNFILTFFKTILSNRLIDEKGRLKKIKTTIANAKRKINIWLMFLFFTIIFQNILLMLIFYKLYFTITNSATAPAPAINIGRFFPSPPKPLNKSPPAFSAL